MGLRARRLSDRKISRSSAERHVSPMRVPENLSDGELNVWKVMLKILIEGFLQCFDNVF